MEQVMAFENNDGFDPIKYGVLWERVQHMDKKITKMESQLDELIALANKGRGGLWFGMSVVSGFSAIVGYFLNNIKGH